MIRSMTAFARQETQGEWGSLTCEIRTVNHRYLEPSFRLPEALRELENGFREHLRKVLGRGKVDVGMRLQSSETADTGLVVNERLAGSSTRLSITSTACWTTRPISVPLTYSGGPVCWSGKIPI